MSELSSKNEEVVRCGEGEWVFVVWWSWLGVDRDGCLEEGKGDEMGDKEGDEAFEQGDGDLDREERGDRV